MSWSLLDFQIFFLTLWELISYFSKIISKISVLSFLRRKKSNIPLMEYISWIFKNYQQNNRLVSSDYWILLLSTLLTKILQLSCSQQTMKISLRPLAEDYFKFRHEKLWIHSSVWAMAKNTNWWNILHLINIEIN